VRAEADTSKERPSACVRFSRPLDARPERHYRDYIKLDPPADSAIRVQDNALCIDGLSFAKTYKIEIAAGLPAKDGATLAAAAKAELSFGERPSVVGFAESGYVLARNGSVGVMVDTVNVQTVSVEVLRIGDRILPSMVSQLRSKAEGDRWSLESLVENSARPVWSGTMDIQGPHNETVHTSFPLAQAITAAQPGAYLIIATNAAELTPKTKDSKFLWQRTDDYRFAAQWVVITDIALTSVSAADGLHVFARSLSTARPVPGVGIDLLARDQQVLGHSVTESDGGAVFAPGLLRGTGAASASAVFAYGPSNDFALLDLTIPAFDLSDRGVGGRDATGPLDVFVYSDRGIYRPGETIEAMALMRDRLGAAIPDAPLTLVLRRPNGLEFKRSTLPAAAAGGFHMTVKLPENASRGAWSIEALDADDASIGHSTIEVQDFVPQRLKVTATSEASTLHPGDKIAVAIDGIFLYGAPAGGLGAEAHMKIVTDAAPFPQSAQGFHFGIAEPHFAPPELDLQTAPTDQKGHTMATGTVPDPSVANLPVKAVITVGIEEPGGRITNQELSLPIRQPGHAIGVKPHFQDGLVEEGDRASFDIVAVDEAGKPVATKLHWTLVAIDEHYDWVQTDNRWSYHVSTTERPVGSGDLDLTADTPAKLEHDVNWGGYKLLIEEPGTSIATTLDFTAGWRATSDAADTPDKVEVTVEHERYAVGDTAHLRIKPPFDGQIQIMVVRDKLFETLEIDARREGTVIDIPVMEEWGSGAYVLASLYRPADGGRGHIPIRAVGLAWVGVDPGKRQLKVAIDAPPKITPRQTVTIPVHLTEGSVSEPVYVTVAAVDEGILQLTRFVSPNPGEFYFGKRRLGAELRDDYGRLLDGTIPAGTLRSGGDDVGGRSLPVVPTRSVAIFSGPLKLDSSGNGQISLDIPDFEGSLRLMAVAYSDQGVGQGEANLIVRDPVVADVSLPRFLAPGDQASLTLLVDNTDGAAGTYHVALTGTGAIEIPAPKPLDFTLKQGERRIETVPLTGTDEGIGTVTAELTGPDGLDIKRDWSLSVRGAHYPITLASTALQPQGQSFTLDKRMLDAFVPGSVSVSLSYSRLAGIDVPGLLQSLWRYPFGCTEQLTSTAFPLLYYQDAALSGQAARDSGIHARVQAAIDRIIDRQNGDGSYGLWRANDNEGSEWLSLYVLDFLMHARTAGYDVPDGAILRGFGFAEDAVQRATAAAPHDSFSHPREDETYAQFLLAQAHRADLGRLRLVHDQLKQGPSLISWTDQDKAPAEPLALAQLSGALALLGDRSRAADSLQMAVTNVTQPHTVNWWGGWSYWSNLRDAAGILAVAAESDQLAAVQPILPKLQEMSRAPDLLTTQEKAWLLTAAHAVTLGDPAIDLTVNGQKISGSAGQAALSPDAAAITAGYTIQNQSDHDLYRSIVVHGSPKTAPSAMNEGVALAKTTMALDGKPLDPAHLTQNQRFIVLLKGAATDTALHHFVVVDPLPAGWEIEAILQPDQAPPFLPHLTHSRLHEARDDRLVAALDVGVRPWQSPVDEEEDAEANSNNGDDDAKNKDAIKAREENRHGQFAVAYIARAVTPGKFTLPEAVIEDMYRPGTTARTKAGTASVDLPK
jgi:uncharacterized protein YfaS (alpha-2-macroglobulin family)